MSPWTAMVRSIKGAQESHHHDGAQRKSVPELFGDHSAVFGSSYHGWPSSTAFPWAHGRMSPQKTARVLSIGRCGALWLLVQLFSASPGSDGCPRVYV